MKIIEDIGQKETQHKIKNNYWENNGVEVLRMPLPVGDYIFSNEKVEDVINRKNKRSINIKKMDFLGTYNICVDTKKDMQEIVGNICGRQHARFRDECILAKNNGIKLKVLIENEDNVHCLDDVFQWENPRLNIMKNSNEVIGTYKNGRTKYKKIRKYPSATSGMTLAKAMLTMEKKYDVEFSFCKPQHAGEKVLELLGGGINVYKEAGELLSPKLF